MEMQMEIVDLKEDNSQWNEFLGKNEHLIFHNPAYKKFIEEAFNCEYKILGFLEEDTLKVILPLVEINSLLFGNKIISSAYLEYGGFAGEGRFIPMAVNLIEERYKDNYDFLEIRGGLEFFNNISDNILSSKLIKKSLYKRFVLQLTGEEEVWKNVQHSKRKAVNKALRDLEVKEVPFSDLNTFYSLYCRNMKRFGSPPYSKKYFISFYKNIVDGNLGKVFGAYHQGKLVSALLGFCYLDRVHIIISVADESYREFRPSDAMHWKFIQWACQKGYKYFDFGRVREESGQFEYKRKWGPELLELPSYFLLWKNKEVPFVDPDSHKLLVKVWRTLPLWFTARIGMKLRKKLGI
ncbi:MAG: GNAT family N-acetyltransferase [Nanoarchaeota archaeon]